MADYWRTGCAFGLVVDVEATETVVVVAVESDEPSLLKSQFDLALWFMPAYIP